MPTTTSSYNSPQVTSSSTYKSSKKMGVPKGSTTVISNNPNESPINKINIQSQTNNNSSYTTISKTNTKWTTSKKTRSNSSIAINNSLDRIRIESQVKRNTGNQIVKATPTTLELTGSMASRFGNLDFYTNQSATLTQEEQVDMAFDKWWDSQYRIDEGRYNPNFSAISVQGFQLRLMYMSSKGTDVSKLSTEDLNKLFLEEAEFQFGATMAMFGAAIGVLKNLGTVEKIIKWTGKTVPEKAIDIANQVKRKNGVAPQGYKGGKTYSNTPVNGGQELPKGVNYKEYDINPYVKGQSRGTERIVIGDDGSVWYTNDHYNTFTRIE